MLYLAYTKTFIVYVGTQAFLVACSSLWRIQILVLLAQAIKVKVRCVREVEPQTLTTPRVVGEIVVEVRTVLSVLVIYLAETFLFLNASPFLIF